MPGVPSRKPVPSPLMLDVPDVPDGVTRNDAPDWNTRWCSYLSDTVVVFDAVVTSPDFGLSFGPPRSRRVTSWVLVVCSPTLTWVLLTSIGLGRYFAASSLAASRW